jgi:hypothetical protein
VRRWDSYDLLTEREKGNPATIGGRTINKEAAAILNVGPYGGDPPHAL